MDARGLVAFIVTVHELAAVLGVLVGALIAILALLLLRSVPPGKRVALALAFSLGAALVTMALTARVFHVGAFDVEVVRVAE